MLVLLKLMKIAPFLVSQVYRNSIQYLYVLDICRCSFVEAKAEICHVSKWADEEVLCLL